MKQTGFAIITRVERDQICTLKERLKDIKDEKHEKYLNFRSVPGVHFASFVLCVDPHDRFEPFLVFENNIDGTSDGYLPVLCERAAGSLLYIYESCLGDPSESGTHRDGLLTYLSKHVNHPDAILLGKVGGTVETILREQVLQERVQEFLGQRRACAHAEHIKVEIDAFVDRERLLDGLPEQRVSRLRKLASYIQPRSTIVNWLLSPSARSLAFVAVALLIGVLCYLVPLLFYVLLGVFAFVIIWLTLLRLTDRQDPPFCLDAKRTRELFEAEALNTSVHNHLAITAIVKPGRYETPYPQVRSRADKTSDSRCRQVRYRDSLCAVDSGSGQKM